MPENFANGQAINPLRKIKTTDAPVNDRAEIGSNDFADREIKIKTGRATSTTNLLAPPRSGLTRRLYRRPTNTRVKMGSVMDAILKNMDSNQVRGSLKLRYN